MKYRNSILLALLSVSSLFALWIIATLPYDTPGKLFPSPVEVFIAYQEMIISGELQNHLSISLFRIFTGLLIGTFLGILVGIATGMHKNLENLLGTIIHLFRPVPIIALVPLVILWLGIGELTKITLITWAVFSIIWVETHLGVKTISRSYYWLAQSLQLNKLQRIQHVILPGIIPYIIAALRIAIPVSYIVLIVAEFAGSSAGLGYLISTSHLSFRLDRMFVGIITLGVLGSISDNLFFRLAKKITWYEYNDKHKI